jgi:hypothetical protein
VPSGYRSLGSRATALYSRVSRASAMH